MFKLSGEVQVLVAEGCEAGGEAQSRPGTDREQPAEGQGHGSTRPRHGALQCQVQI